MLLEILIALILGCIVGTFSGLTPGIHINLISLLVLAASPILLHYFSPIALAVFIVSMAIIHTFTDSIPSIFLGAPESDTALAVLPGHRLLLKGRGYEAIILMATGSLVALIISILLIPAVIPFLKIVYPFLNKYMAYILIIVVVYLVLREKSRLWALVIFLLSGVLGIVVFNLPMLKDPLFPMLSGLFGISMLLVSLKDKVKIPEQKITFPDLSRKDYLKSFTGCVIGGSLTSFFPGLGPAQGAIIGSEIAGNQKEEAFLMMVGGISTLNMIFSIVGLYAINKARNGAIVIMSKILENFTLNNLLLVIGVILITSFIAIFLTLKLTKLFSKLITKVNYQKLCFGIIILVCSLVLLLTSWIGFLVMIVSVSIGLIAPLKDISRNHLMGCLILPVIFYFIL